MEIFTAMGEEVARRWDAAHGEEQAFAAIAEQVLGEQAPHTRASIDEVFDWVLFAPSPPRQQHRLFGQPPLNLYVGSGFYIEANVWLDGSTSIHEHRFSGAFTMLAGRSLHARYRFDEDERVNAYLRLGRMSLLDAEILAVGEVRRIESGGRFIHAARHLDRPSVSLVIRTDIDPEARPQLDYFPPSVAADPRPDREPLRTRLDLLDALAEVDADRHCQVVLRMLETENRYVVYRVLATAFPRLSKNGNWAKVEEHAACRHGAFIQRLLPSLRETVRRDAVHARRTQVRDERARLLLALLTSLPHRPALLDVVRKLMPGHDPEEWILDGILLLADAGALGMKLDAISYEILRCLMQGRAIGEVMRHLERQFPAARIPSRAAEVELAVANLRASPVLEPLFTAGDPTP